MQPSRYVLALTVVAAFSTAAFAADGKAIFLAQTCNQCHSIDSQGVAKTSDKIKAPDLSNAAKLAESADWLKKFLKKEVDHNGKKHLREFKGTDEELDTVAKWLASLKTS